MRLRSVSLQESPLARTLAGFRWRVGLTYVLTIVENLLQVSYPWLTGLAIDGLLAQRYTELSYIVIAWTLRTIVGAVRQVYDTKLFSRIYADVAAETVLRQRGAGVSTGEVAARTTMARDVVLFFERDVPTIATAIIGILGSAVALYFYDLLIGAIVSLLFLPVLIVNRYYASAVVRLNRGLNNRLEREMDVVSRATRPAVLHHFRSVRAWRVRLSNAEAANWTFIEMVSILVFVAVLVRSTLLPTTETGDIYAILSYVWHLMESLDHVPYAVQQAGRLWDIRRRLDSGEALEEAVAAGAEDADAEGLEPGAAGARGGPGGQPGGLGREPASHP